MAGNIPVPSDPWHDGRLDIGGDWPEVLVLIDMTFWADRIACAGRPRPALRELCRLYGWSRGRLRGWMVRHGFAEPKKIQSGTKSNQTGSSREQLNLINDEGKAQEEPKKIQSGTNGSPPLKGTRAKTSPSPSPSPSRHTADFAAALAVYNDDVRPSFDQPMRPTRLKPSSGQGKKLSQMIKAHGADEVLEVLRWWATAQDHGLNGGAAFHRSRRSGLDTIKAHFDRYLDNARNPYKPTGGVTNGGRVDFKAEARTVLAKVNGYLRDRSWHPDQLGDGAHARAARAGIAACGGIDDFRRSNDEIGDRMTFTAAYIEARGATA